MCNSSNKNFNEYNVLARNLYIINPASFYSLWFALSKRNIPHFCLLITIFMWDHKMTRHIEVIKNLYQPPACLMISHCIQVWRDDELCMIPASLITHINWNECKEPGQWSLSEYTKCIVVSVIFRHHHYWGRIENENMFCSLLYTHSTTQVKVHQYCLVWLSSQSIYRDPCHLQCLWE